MTATAPRGWLGERLGLSRLAGWRPLQSHVDELLLVPKDLRAADPVFATEVRRGQMGLAGRVTDLGGRSPFVVPPPSVAWAAELHGFGWLRHLNTAGTPDAIELARRLTADWIDRERGGPSLEPVAGAPEVTARRIMSWLASADILLERAAAQHYRRVLLSLARSIEALERTSGRASGPARLTCRIALVMAGLALSGQERRLARHEPELLAELARQIFADGGHVSRNPEAVLDLLLDLHPLRHCYLARGQTPPALLVDTIDRMTGFVRTLQLGNGSLARFNGAGSAGVEAVATVLALDPGTRAAAIVLTQSGYMRLARGETVVVVDCGNMPATAAAAASGAHAGCLSIEISSGPVRLFGNGGAPGASADAAVRVAARAAESHATLSLAGASGTGPVSVSLAQTAMADRASMTAAHDGFAAAYGLVHRRRLTLSDDGATLEGHDELQPPGGVLRTVRDVPFAIRFHLDMAVAATVELDGSQAVLDAGRGGRWELTVTGARAAIEPSIDYTGSAGPRAGRQIVLRGACPGHSSVAWRLARVGS